VLLEEPGVRVTTTRVTLGDATYPVAGLTSIRLEQEGAGGLPFVLCAVGVVTLLFAGALTFVAFGFGMAPEANLGAVIGTAIFAVGLGLFGLLILGWAAAAARAETPYLVILGTAGGDRQGLKTSDRARADRVRAAIEEAVTRRG